jgi:hypothetical protein
MPLKKLKPFVEKFYIHYDKKTGIIRSISNEPTLYKEASLEVPFEEYREFIEGIKNPQDYIVGFAKDENGKPQRRLIKVTDQLYGFKSSIFEWIRNPPTKTTELIVEWNSAGKKWIFNLGKKGKDRAMASSQDKIIFFVMLKNDFDFLIRTITLDVGMLIKEGVIEIPFKSKIENQIDKISISSQIFFHSYGLIIND